jgi:hypothetical protein
MDAGREGPRRMDTAPRDGTPILVFVDGAWRITRWSAPYLNGRPYEQSASWEPHTGDGVFYTDPVAWHPLPGNPT